MQNPYTDNKYNPLSITKDMNLVDFYKFETGFDQDYDLLRQTLREEDLRNIIGKMATKQLFIALKFKNEARENALKQFRNHINKSDKIDIKQKRTLSLKGFFSYFKGDVKQAHEYFENAKNMDGDYLPYLIGKGLIEYNRKNYRQALLFFKRIFKFYRHVVKKAAYIMGLCYFHLRNYSQAERCFNYSIKHNGLIQSGQMGLALVKFKQNDIEGYFDNLKLAFLNRNSNEKNINMYLALSEFYFYKKDYKRAIKIAEKSLEELDETPNFFSNNSSSLNSDYDEVRSRLLYIKAFIAHAENSPESLPEAYKYYKQAIDFNPLNLSAQFGFSKILYKQKNYVEADKCIQAIISKQSEHFYKECYFLMPHIYMRLDKNKEAIEAFEKALKYFSSDLRLLIDYAFYLEINNSKKAFHIYKKIYNKLDQLEKDCPDVSAEVLNNMAVSFIKNQENTIAEKIISFIDKRLVKEENETKRQAISLVIKYNTAAIYIKNNFIEKAMTVYNDLLKENPLFYDCYMQLAKLNLFQDNVKGFDEFINKAIFIAYRNHKIEKVEYPVYLQVQGLIAKHRYQEAFNICEKLKGMNNHIKLLKARINYSLVAHNRTKIDEVKDNIKKASLITYEVLKQPTERGNIYAANLCACLLAERGRVKDSLTIFRSFIDVLEGDSPLLYNLALAEFLDKNYEKAITILESPRSGRENRKSELYAFLNMLLGNFEVAEKVFKYRYMREPNLFSYYNYISFLLKKIKNLCFNNKDQIRNVDSVRNELEFSKQALKKIETLISPKMVSLLGGLLNFEEIKRMKYLNLKKLCSKNYLFIEHNQQNYENVFNERLSQMDKLKNFKSVRMGLIERRKQKLTIRKKENEKQKNLRQLELEEKARKANQMAQNIINDINQIKEEEQKKKERPKKKPKEKTKKKISKKKKKPKKKKEEIIKEDSDDDNFIQADISDEEEIKDFNIYGDVDNNEDEIIYNPSQVNKIEESPRKTRRTNKLSKISNQGYKEIEQEEPIDDNTYKQEPVDDNLYKPEIKKKKEEKVVSNVNEDIYVNKNRKNKLLLDDDDDSD